MAHLLNPKLVGLETADSPQEVLHVHQALLDEQCHPLCDELREYWKFFDHETVQRFALYLYKEDYSYPKPSPVKVTTPRRRGGSSKPVPSPESRTSSFPPPGAIGVSGATSGVWGTGAGGSSYSSADSTGAPRASETPPETVEKLGQLSRDEPSGPTKPTFGAPTTTAGTTGRSFGFPSSGTASAFAASTETGAKPTAASGTAKPASAAPTVAAPIAGGLFGTTGSSKTEGLFGAGNSGTTGGLPGTASPWTTGGLFGTPRPGTTGASWDAIGAGVKPAATSNTSIGFGGGAFGTTKLAFSNTTFGGGGFGAAKPAPGDPATTTGATRGLFGTPSASERAANSSKLVGTVHPRPEFVSCKIGMDDEFAVALSQNIGCMPEYMNWSLEELRLQDYLALGKLYNIYPGEVPTGKITPPTRPLTPLESFKIPNLHRISEATPPKRPDHPAGYDFEAVLLAHARLYILSRSQRVNALSDLCISRLWNELGHLSVPPIEPRISNNVVQLLRYVYRSPQDMAAPEAIQPAWRQLQDLASQFCALNIQAMGAEPAFRALFQEGGTLAIDIMDKTLRRLTSAESGPPDRNHPVAQDALPNWNQLVARDSAIKRLFGKPEDATPVRPAFGKTPAAS